MKIQQFLRGTEYMYNVACLFGRHDGTLNFVLNVTIISRDYY